MNMVGTTPFGRQTVTLAYINSQAAMAAKVAGMAGDTAIDKWRLFRALAVCRSRFGLSDRALMLLNALLSFHPEAELAAGQGLVVFPSNAQLSTRAHGMAEQTIRRHLAALVEAGLILRKDSANGKRFARRNGAGAIGEAYGFSLAPLLARAAEIEAAAAEIEADRLMLRALKERLTICRRDIARLIGAGLEEGASGDWDDFAMRYRAIVADIPRHLDQKLAERILDSLEALRTEILNSLDPFDNSEKPSGNACQNERLIQNSNTDSFHELEPCLEIKQAATSNQKPADREKERGGEDGESRPTGILEPRLTAVNNLPVTRSAAGARAMPRGRATKRGDDASGAAFHGPFPLSMVLRACPQVADYGPGGAISSWRDMMNAAVVIRSMLGVSPTAYEEACAVLGPENAATAMACILERAGHINSAGGYLRDLTRKAERGEFSLHPMVMALMRANAGSGRNHA